jgi:hypothetical protein
MMMRMNGLLAASVASLVLFSGIGVSAAAKRPAPRHRTTASRPQTSPSKSAGSSHAKHKKGHKSSHKHRTIKH